MYVFLVFDLVFLACCYEDIRMLYIISQCPLLILFHLDGKSQSRGAPLPVPPFPPLSLLTFPQNGRLIFLVFVSSPPVDRWIDHVTWSSSPPTGQGGESFVATFFVGLLLQDGGGCKRRRRGRGARALVIIMNFFLT